MNVNFLNPFLDAANEVLKQETRLDFIRGGLSLDKSHYISDDVTVILAIVGMVSGNVFYSMDQATALNLASRMMYEPFEEFNSLAQSGIAELGNVITGKASVKLSQSGYEATISPPTLIQGKGATINTLDYPRIIVPLVAENASVVIHLALKETAGSRLNAAAIPVPDRPNI